MSENLKTIKELADELSVTKQNIQYHYQRLPKELQLKSSNGSNLINSKAEKIILGKVESGSKSNTKDQQISSKENFEDEKLDNPFLNRLIKEVEYLKIDKDKIISTKDQQISSKDQQIEKLTNLLDQQQRLALQDKKLLEEYKSEINELKALKMPQEDMKDGSSIRGEAQEEIERLKAQLKLSEEERNKAKEKEPVKTESKKWWHFGRM